MSEIATLQESVQAESVRHPQFEVFFDGACPLCRREMTLLKRLDRKQQILLTDISAPDFDATALGKTHEDLMARIHGRQPDGSFVEGVEVFRQLYLALGWKWMVTLTRLPIISQMLNLGYTIFARNRLRLTGRCTNDTCQIRQEGTRISD